MSTAIHPPSETREHDRIEDEAFIDYDFSDATEALEWLETARYVRVADCDWQKFRSGYNVSDYTPGRFQTVDDRYELTTRACYSSQRRVARAWADWKFPQHNVKRSGSAILYSSPNFRGIQRPDGRGRLVHYSTTEAWRTRSGLVFNNTDCWSRGFARCDPPRPDQRDHTASFRLLEEVLDRCGAPDDPYDIVSVERGGGIRRAYRLESGAMLVFFSDHTARGGPEECAFVLDAEKTKTISEPAEALGFLKPTAVHAAEQNGLEVVGSHESQDDPRIPGEVVVRQGEWFFIPMDGDFEPSATHPNGVDTPLGNHEPRDFGLTPRPYDEGGYDSFVRGWVRHRRDHREAYLGEWWHRAVSHDETVVVIDDIDTSSGRRSRGRRRTRYD